MATEALRALLLAGTAWAIGYGGGYLGCALGAALTTRRN